MRCGRGGFIIPIHRPVDGALDLYGPLPILNDCMPPLRRNRNEEVKESDCPIPLKWVLHPSGSEVWIARNSVKETFGPTGQVRKAVQPNPGQEVIMASVQIPSCIYFVSQLSRVGPLANISNLADPIDCMNCNQLHLTTVGQCSLYDWHPRPSIKPKWFVKLPMPMPMPMPMSRSIL